MFKYQIGEVVYANDSYRGHIGKIKRIEPANQYAYQDMYFLDIIKKVQPTFYMKRWDNELFWESNIYKIKSYDDKNIYLDEEIIDPKRKTIKIMSNEEMIEAVKKYGGHGYCVEVKNFDIKQFHE